MIKKKKLLFLIIIFSLATNSLHAKDKISINEFLNLAQKQHPFFIKEEIGQKIIETKKQTLTGEKDTQIEISPYFLYQEPSGSYLTESDLKKRKETGIRFGTSKNIWSTGGQLSLEYKTSKMHYDELSSITGEKKSDHEYGNSITVKYYQPILKNFRGKLDKFEYNLQDYDLEISKLNSIENKEDFLVKMAQVYLEWIYLDEELKITKKRLELAETSYKKAYKRYRSNMTERGTLLRISEELNSVKSYFYKSKMNWKAKQAQISALVSDKSILKKSPAIDVYNLAPLVLPEKLDDFISKKSRILKILYKQRDKAAYASKIYDHMTLPEMGFDLSATRHGFHNKTSQARKLKKPEYYIGLKFSMPLENNEARGKLQQADLLIKQLELEINSIMRDLKAETTQVLIQLKEYQKIIKINKEQLKISQDKTHNERKKFRQGRSTIFYVIESRDREYSVNLSYLQNVIQYHLLYYKYQNLTDQLIKK